MIRANPWAILPNNVQNIIHFTRAEQDEFALLSLQRAKQATEDELSARK